MKPAIWLLILTGISQIFSIGIPSITIYNKQVMLNCPSVHELGEKDRFEIFINELYNQCELEHKLEYKVFRLAITGYANMKIKELLFEKAIIAVIDYTVSANKKRFFVIDLDSKHLLYNTLVAHGKNTGNKYAEHFSNEPKSRKSSMGFFITGGTYNGKHGYTLELDGVDTLFNDNARKRSIVIHGANYVSRDFIKQYGRIGRSWGCPALPMNSYKAIIDKIKGGCCLFIYYNDENYLSTSKYLNIGTSVLQYVK